MSGKPWERYGPRAGAATAPATGKPWERYDQKSAVGASSSDTAAAADAEPAVIQEMHPDFSLKDRFVAKNLSPTPEDAADYLRRQHGNLEIVVKDGEIRARAKGSKEPYKVMDPSLDMPGTATGPTDLRGIGRDLWTGLKETGMDAMDVAGDVASGLATGAANVAGGLGGALAGAPLGPAGALAGGVAGASAAGGATGLGLEALKQRLAQAVGAQGEGLNNFNLAVAGGSGAVSPLLFGSGASKAAIQAAGVSAASQRGGLGLARDFAAPVLNKVGEKMTGISRDTIKALSDFLPEIKAAEKDPMAMTRMTEGAQDLIKSGTQQVTGAAQAGVDAAIDAAPSGTRVGLGPTAAELNAAIAKISSEGAGNDASKELLDALKTAKDRLLTHDVERTTTELAPSKLLNELGNPVLTPREVTSTVREPITDLAPRQAHNLKKQLAGDAGFGRAGTGGVGGRDLSDYLTRGVEMPLGGATKALQSDLEAAVPGLADATAKQSEAINLRNDLTKRFVSDDKTAQSFRNMSGADSRVFVEKLGQLQRMVPEAKVLDAARKAEAFQVFARPSFSPLSQGKASGIARAGMLGSLGAGAGAALDARMPGGGHKGAYLGGAMGAGMASPAFVRALISASQAAAGSMRPNVVTNSAAPSTAQDIWKFLTP